jgi:DNA-directed RNA polymerase specialized sigma24 family protein
MSETTVASPPIQASHFVECILPKVERHARFAFRWLTNPADQEDAIQETIALCWAWASRLATQGKDAAQFAWALANFASRRVMVGRRLCGRENADDVYSPAAQRRHGFRLEEAVTWREALVDNTQTPPPDAAAFRLDFPQWLAEWAQRDRDIIEQLMLGERTSRLARKLGTSEGRVSQLRRKYQESWQHFHGEPIAC